MADQLLHTKSGILLANWDERDGQQGASAHHLLFLTAC